MTAKVKRLIDYEFLDLCRLYPEEINYFFKNNTTLYCSYRGNLYLIEVNKKLSNTILSYVTIFSCTLTGKWSKKIDGYTSNSSMLFEIEKCIKRMDSEIEDFYA